MKSLGFFLILMTFSASFTQADCYHEMLALSASPSQPSQMESFIVILNHLIAKRAIPASALSLIKTDKPFDLFDLPLTSLSAIQIRKLREGYRMRLNSKLLEQEWDQNRVVKIIAKFLEKESGTQTIVQSVREMTAPVFVAGKTSFFRSHQFYNKEQIQFLATSDGKAHISTPLRQTGGLPLIYPHFLELITLPKETSNMFGAKFGEPPSNQKPFALTSPDGKEVLISSLSTPNDLGLFWGVRHMAGLFQKIFFTPKHGFKVRTIAQSKIETPTHHIARRPGYEALRQNSFTLDREGVWEHGFNKRTKQFELWRSSIGKKVERVPVSLPAPMLATPTTFKTLSLTSGELLLAFFNPEAGVLVYNGKGQLLHTLSLSNLIAKSLHLTTTQDGRSFVVGALENAGENDNLFIASLETGEVKTFQLPEPVKKEMPHLSVVTLKNGQVVIVSGNPHGEEHALESVYITNTELGTISKVQLNDGLGNLFWAYLNEDGILELVTNFAGADDTGIYSRTPLQLKP